MMIIWPLTWLSQHPFLLCLLLLIQLQYLNLSDASDDVVFSNPLLSNYSNNDDIFTSKNRCLLYPRCLLFNCCNEHLQRSVHKYFSDISSQIGRHSKQYLLTPSCEHDSTSFADRFAKIPLRNVDVLTVATVQDGIAQLPPTHPKAYLARETCCNFRVLYLVQGDNKAGLPPAYSQMKDMIFINYKLKEGGPTDLYFPGSLWLHGRMALYLAARQLEISQGWLYDYFVFTDDDCGVDVGNYTLFESFLKQWRPAIGFPSLKKYPNRLFEAINHADWMFLAYHREAVEVLFPYIIDYDHKCGWCSTLVACFEASYLYRNHVMATSIMHIYGLQHRPYNRDTSLFPTALRDFKAAIHPNMQHCSPDDVSSYYQGMKSGVARPKMGSYHLMDSHLRKIHESESSTCPKLSFYPSLSFYNCCTIDNDLFLEDSNSSSSEYNNKIVTENNVDYYYIFGNTKHAVPLNAAIYMDVGPIIDLKDRSVLQSFNASKLTLLNSKCAKENTKDLWDEFARNVRQGLSENKLVQAHEMRSVYFVRNSSLHYINFQQFVSMGFDFDQVNKVSYSIFEQIPMGSNLDIFLGQNHRRI